MSEYIPWIVAAITTLGAIASTLFSFRNNSSSIKNDIIVTYEKRMKQLDDDMKSIKAELKLMSDKFDKSETDRKAAEAILQGRNPELDRYMALTLKMLTDIHGAVMPQTAVPIN